MEEKERKTSAPKINTRLRHNILEMPPCIRTASGIPVIITVTKKNTDIQARLDAGATILNVACAQDTPEVVADIRRKFPDVPIIASGGKSEESIMKTINAGANAITYTPPSTQDLFKEMMSKYRE